MGLSVQEVQNRLGHGDINTTINIYAYITEKQRDKVAEIFAQYISFSINVFKLKLTNKQEARNRFISTFLTSYKWIIYTLALILQPYLSSNLPL